MCADRKKTQTRGPGPGHGAVTGGRKLQADLPQLPSPRPGRVEPHDDVTRPDTPVTPGPSLRAAATAPVANSATEGSSFCLGTRTNAEPVPAAPQSATSASPTRLAATIAFDITCVPS
jgi:hypothetical protein